MNDDDFKAAFRALDPVEPSAEFLRAVRSIPHRYPRAAAPAASLWRLFGAPNRLFALGLSAACGLFVGYLTLDDEMTDDELTAFMELEVDDTALPNATELEWDAP